MFQLQGTPYNFFFFKPGLALYLEEGNEIHKLFQLKLYKQYYKRIVKNIFEKKDFF